MPKKFRPETIKKALFTTSALNFISRCGGYLKNISIAALLGFTYETDAYFFALGIIAIFSIFSGTISSVGVPWLTQARQKNARSFAKAAAQLLGFNVWLGGIITLVTLLVLPIVVNLFLLENRLIFALILLVLFPTVALNFLYNYFGTVLQAQRLFTIQTAAFSINSLAQFLLITTGLFVFRSIWVLPFSTLLALVLAIAWQILFVYKHLRPDFRLDKRVKELIRQFLVFAVLGATSTLYSVIDKAFASYLPTKSISALVYGALIAQLPLGIISLNSMFFTSISEKISWVTIRKFTLIALVISLPYALVLAVIPEFLVDLILGYGRFGGLDVQYTAQAVRYYALALPAFYLSDIFNNTLVVQKAFGGLFFVSSMNVILNVAANYVFLFKFGLGLAGLVLATAIVSYFSLFLQAGLVVYFSKTPRTVRQ
ncbi:putative MVIN family virulence factor [Candidatus Termititenax persephonae]|uniref:MVIN family virulence factor n=1 Tax=Candidatus Termititenax persephonae TaxID=2218525 RepID=A0A388TED3_9BACT|nr:putative MVIN family virulence factor [Candidatus Termititenax persephonae]